MRLFVVLMIVLLIAGVVSAVPANKIIYGSSKGSPYVIVISPVQPVTPTGYVTMTVFKGNEVVSVKNPYYRYYR
jgi:hypothetical protein